MKQTVYVECPRIVTKHYQRENAWGGIDDCEPETPCGWDVEVLVERHWNGDDPSAELQQDECDSCNHSWTFAEEEQMLELALAKAMREPLDCGDIRND